MSKKVSMEHTIRDLLRMMTAELPEPWELICGKEKHLPWCQAEGVIGKTVYMPYGTVEGEPSYPCTNMNPEIIRAAFNKAAEYPELKGVMTNVQTPLLQFPNLFFWHNLAWDPQYRTVRDEDALIELAEQLYPAHKELIAACFAAFGSVSVENMDELIIQLEQLLAKNSFRKTGSFGQKLFPSPEIVAQSLLLQLKFMSARQQFLNLPEQPFDMNHFKQTLVDFFDAYLAWDLAHGCRELFGYSIWVLGFDSRPPIGKHICTQFQSVLKYIHKQIGLGPELETLFTDVKSRLTAKYDPALISEGCIDPLRNDLRNAVQKKT